MVPDPNKIDRSKDLKLWIPIPREWDSQKAVKIISVEPEPHAKYVDPEYGNPMLFWDFGKEPEQPIYKVDIKFRLESYDVSVQVDPEQVGSYDKTSKEYAVYTQSTHTISITPKIRELAQVAIGNEENSYIQADRIFNFVRQKMRFKRLAFERGRGIACLLAYPVTDEEPGQEYYEGACNQYATLMVALCRAVGIPARCVSGYIGWNPWVDPNDVKARYPFETKLSPEGLAATQTYGELIPHMWSEFFIPNYGWIPADAQRNIFGHQDNRLWIKYKGRDIQLGPYAPQEDSEGYGVNWVALHKGKADSLCYGALNIAKIHDSKVTVLHYSDPFPADGLVSYNQKPGLVVPQPIREDVMRWRKHYRQEALSLPCRFVRDSVPDSFSLTQLYSEYPETRATMDGIVCGILRRHLGDEQFEILCDKYIKLRQKSKKAVPTIHFQKLAEDIHGKPLEWFFSQWINSTELPRLKLENVTATQDNYGWRIRGRLVQSAKNIFRLPIELAIDIENGREIRTLWMDDKVTDIDLRTLSKPEALIVDPEYKVLKLQEMPPHLVWHWDVFPEYIIVYGTIAEAKANRTAAERFCGYWLGVSGKKIRADMDVNDADLRAKCVILFGRPETNTIAQQFKGSFPIKFDGAKFTWQGTTYSKPTQGVAQVIENPKDGGGLIVMYSGLSPEATLNMWDLGLYDSDCSYVIFDGDKQLVSDDWENVDSNLYWKNSSHTSAVSLSNQR